MAMKQHLTFTPQDDYETVRAAIAYLSETGAEDVDLANFSRSLGLTERQLTRLADYLRLALESTDEKGMTPDRERALESAVAALRESGAYSHDLTLSA